MINFLFGKFSIRKPKHKFPGYGFVIDFRIYNSDYYKYKKKIREMNRTVKEVKRELGA